MQTNWESGKLKLTAKDFNQFRIDFIGDYNYQLQEEMTNANNLTERVLADWDYVINPSKDTGQSPRATVVDYYEYSRVLMDDYKLEPDTFEKMFLHRKHTWPPQYLTDLNIGIARANQTIFDIDNYEAKVKFSIPNKTITWTVSQNVEAVQHARESLMGKLFFNTMDAIEWAEGYGGNIIGNDLDNMNIGGANYITYTFG